MKILAFDTSTSVLSIALLEDGKAVLDFHEEAGIRHSEILVPTIDRMLRDADWAVRDIDLVATGIGPGSFTGLRIAVSTVKGLAAVLGSKVIGVPTMDVMVMNVDNDHGFASPLMDARKGKVYACFYDLSGSDPVRVSDHMLVTIDELLSELEREVVFFGDAVVKYKERLDNHPLARYIEDIDWYPRAVELGKIALKRSASGTDDPEAIDPLYLHAKECNITHKGRRND